MNQECIFYEVAVIGESGVGKTTLIRSLNAADRGLPIMPTIGLEFVSTNFQLAGRKARLFFTDFCNTFNYDSSQSGQPWNCDIVNQCQNRHLERTHIVVLVYKVIEESSFNFLNQWVEWIKSQGKNKDVLLIGTHRDRCFLDRFGGSNRIVGEKRAQLLAREMNGVAVQGCALMGEPLERALKLLMRRKNLLGVPLETLPRVASQDSDLCSVQ